MKFLKVFVLEELLTDLGFKLRQPFKYIPCFLWGANLREQNFYYYVFSFFLKAKFILRNFNNILLEKYFYMLF